MDNEFNDVVVIRKIITLTKEIGLVYKKLILEDLSGKKTNLEYNNLLLKLQEYKLKENELYEFLELNDERVIEIREYLGHLAVLHGYSNINLGFYSSFNRQVQELWLYRISDKLSFYNQEYRKHFNDVINEKVDNDDLSYIQSVIFNNGLNEDFIDSFSYFLSLEKLNCENDNMKKIFINMQYNLAFINSNIEESFLESGIDGQKDLYLRSDMIGDIVKIPKEQKDELQEDKGRNYVSYAVERIIELLDLENEDTIHLQKVYSLYLRSALPLLYNSDNYEDIILDIKNQVMQYEDERGEENESLKELVYKHLNTDNPDKSKCKYLSFFNKK